MYQGNEISNRNMFLRKLRLPIGCEGSAKYTEISSSGRVVQRTNWHLIELDKYILTTANLIRWQP